MEKHCESEKQFGKEGTATAARNEILEGFMRDKGKKAYALAQSLAGNEAEAHELVQEALYRVARAWDKFEQSRPLDAWFSTILRNAFLDSRRRAGRKCGVSLDRPLDGEDGGTLAEVLPDGAESIQTRLERAESVQAVRTALQGLPDLERTVLRLRDLDGRKYEDIARKLGIPVGTVRSRIFRARQALRTQSPELAALAC